VRASVVEKGPSSMGKISTVAVPSATLGTGSSTPRHQALCSRDKSVRRSAQDDVFCGELEMKKTSVVSDFLLSAKQVSAYGTQSWATLSGSCRTDILREFSS